jgi:hypothetical protein
MAGLRRPLPLAIRVASAGLLAAIAFTGCNSATGSSQPAAATPTPTQPQAATATPAPTPTAAALQPPAAPTGLNEWIVPISDADGTRVAAQFFWTPPSGQISGYYFWKKGNYTDEETAPPAICGPTWQVLSASATKYEIPSVQSPPEAYICAFNDAGTSPTVRFPITKDLTAE